MSYQSARNRELRDAHFRHIEEFARAYKKGRPTIVFLPGGMGSQLDRSGKPYAGEASLPFNTYDPIWMDLGIIFDSEVLQLEIKPNGHDLGNHIIIPNGPLRFLLQPYDATQAYFRDREYNYIVFAYDWRRSIGESAGYLKTFLKRLKARVESLRQEDPLPHTTLLCHSMGGLVAKVFLHRVFKSNTTAAEVRQWMARMVTVGSPFYGTSTHMTRYYKGQDPLNILYGAKKLARVSGTLPGTYILMFIDQPTFNRYASQLEISRYPVRDAADLASSADPYDASFANRFPPWVSSTSLSLAAQMWKTVTKPMPDAVVDHVFHIRATKKKTWVELKWAPVNGAQFDPDIDPSPISGTKGDGDGTVPWWSARLVQVPDNQVFNLKKAGEHQELLEHPETLKVITRLIEKDQMPQSVTAPSRSLGRPKASKQAVAQFMADVAVGQLTRNDTRAVDERIWRRIVQEVNLC